MTNAQLIEEDNRKCEEKLQLRRQKSNSILSLLVGLHTVDAEIILDWVSESIKTQSVVTSQPL